MSESRHHGLLHQKVDIGVLVSEIKARHAMALIAWKKGAGDLVVRVAALG